MKYSKILLIFFLPLIIALIGIPCAVHAGAQSYSEPKKDIDIYVDLNKQASAFKGTTLFALYHRPDRPRIVEVTMEGKVVWEYYLPAYLSQFTNPGFDVERLENGNTLFVLPRKGIFEIDKEGNTVWTYEDNKVSHDVDRLPNGNTLIVFGNDDTQEDFQVKEINNKGEIVWKWSAKNSFDKPPFNTIYNQGWTHTNGASRLKNGNTLINLRNFARTIIVNPNGNVIWSVDWKMLGTSPHDTHQLPNNKLLLALKNPHRVIEWDMKTNEVVWEFSKDQVKVIRNASRLPNGNTLVVERRNIFEVTAHGKIVWHLGINGVSGEERDHGRWLYTAQRIPY
ncbi:MAG: aryl-sulfate sulfotransferase [bacterium]|nr:aryl-sulfate sulfotransferase [bacterium]MBU1917595.1 aryl-sulfate sulfotransferase [bacterium]